MKIFCCFDAEIGLEVDEINQEIAADDSHVPPGRDIYGARGCSFLVAFQHPNAPSVWWGVDCLKCLRVFTNFSDAMNDRNHTCHRDMELSDDVCSNPAGYVSKFLKYHSIFPSVVESSPGSTVTFFRTLLPDDVKDHTLVKKIKSFQCSFCHSVFKSNRTARTCVSKHTVGTSSDHVFVIIEPVVLLFYSNRPRTAFCGVWNSRRHFGGLETIVSSCCCITDFFISFTGVHRMYACSYSFLNIHFKTLCYVLSAYNKFQLFAAQPCPGRNTATSAINAEPSEQYTLHDSWRMANGVDGALYVDRVVHKLFNQYFSSSPPVEIFANLRAKNIFLDPKSPKDLVCMCRDNDACEYGIVCYFAGSPQNLFFDD